MYSTRFDDVEDRDMSSPMQGVSTSTASGLLGGNNLDTSLPETFRAPPRPLPYDTDPRYLRAVRDGLISRRDKSGMSHLHTGETEPLRRISLHGPDGGGGEALTPLQRRNGGNGGGSEHNEELGQGYKPDSPGKRLPSSKGFARVESTMSLAEDEDMCPTCLDGYTDENPKIMTACGHHFHLACIYEWMERSTHCPMCDKEMIFNESL